MKSKHCVRSGAKPLSHNPVIIIYSSFYAFLVLKVAIFILLLSLQLLSKYPQHVLVHLQGMYVSICLECYCEYAHLFIKQQSKVCLLGSLSCVDFRQKINTDEDVRESVVGIVGPNIVNY